MRAKKTAQKTKKTIIFSDDFYSDMTAENMLYAMIVRSPFPCGKINQIGFEDGTVLPEGYYLFTAADLENQKTVVTFGTRTEIFCSSEIKYKGEPLALLAGPDKKVLSYLLEKIKIVLNSKELLHAEKLFEKTYNSLSVSPYDGTSFFSENQNDEDDYENNKFAEPENDFSEKLKSAHENEDFLTSDFDPAFTLKKRELTAKRDVSCGDAEKEFSNPDNIIIEETWENSVTQHEIKETSGCFCFLRGGNLHIFTSGRFITHLKDSVNRATGIEKENIILTCTKQSTQNSNRIWMNGIFAAMAGLACIKTGKPVRLCLSREEEINYIEKPVKVKVNHKTALSKDGTIKAMDIEINADTGYKNPLSAEMLDRFVIAASGIYKTENLKIRAKIFSSNNAPSSVKLNRIDSQIFFALENQIQKICEVAGFSPLELRLKNLKNLKSAKSRNKNSKNPFLLELGRAEDSMKAVCNASDFNRKYAAYRLDEKGRAETDETSPYSPPLRGIALAAGFDGNGYLGTTFRSSRFSLQVTLTEEKKLFVNTAPPSQNIKEIWQKLILDTIGDVFDLDRRSIYFNFDQASIENETELAKIQNDLMIGNIGIKTHLLKSCLSTLKSKKDEKLPLVVKKSISPAKKKQWNEDSFSGIPFFSTSFGACVVEVEYDSCTYSEKIDGVYAVIDCGKIVNPEAAETTAKQAIRKCLSTLMDGSKLRTANIVVKFAQSEDEPKNLDSLIYSILPAAFCSATSQAIASKVNFLPLKTESLFEIKESKNQIKETEETENKSSGNSDEGESE